MAEIPTGYKDLLEKKVYAHLATAGPDGRVASNPVWLNSDGRHIFFNSARGRLKDRWIRKNPHVALSLVDPENPYRYLEIRGRVVDITEDGADAHIDQLAHKYLGTDYPFRQPGEVRVKYTVEPEHFSSMG